LEHHAHAAAQSERIEARDVLAPEANRSRGGPLEPVAEPQQGGLAGTRRPGDDGDAAGGDRAVGVGQEIAVGASDPDMVEVEEGAVDGRIVAPSNTRATTGVTASPTALAI
jgi:hypothetical protein